MASLTINSSACGIALPAGSNTMPLMVPFVDCPAAIFSAKNTISSSRMKSVRLTRRLLQQGHRIDVLSSGLRTNLRVLIKILAEISSERFRTAMAWAGFGRSIL